MEVIAAVFGTQAHGNHLNGIIYWTRDAVEGTVADGYTVSTCERPIFVSSISAHGVGIVGNSTSTDLGSELGVLGRHG